MREYDAMFDAMQLQGTALDVRLALRRLRLGLGELRDSDRAAFADAIDFIERARRGQSARGSRRLSATPLSDLLALMYTEEAVPHQTTQSADIDRSLDELARALAALGRGEPLTRRGPWTLARIDGFFRRIFGLATGMVGQRIEMTRSRVRPSALTFELPTS